MKLRPYLSLDLETTGLNTEKSHILQVGWIIDDGVTPRDQLKKGVFYIENPVITHGEAYAIGMNAWIFQDLMKSPDQRKYPTANLFDGLSSLMNAIAETAFLAEKFDIANGHKPLRKAQVAGKNVGHFDWPIILSNLNKAQSAHQITHYNYWDDVKSKLEFVDHRFIDVGAMYFEQFGKNPGFNAINKLIGYKDITHDALDDAMNVVVAIRHRMGIKI
jgi:oligoribonuclease (3'-5' exoribonuclease)